MSLARIRGGLRDVVAGCSSTLRSMLSMDNLLLALEGRDWDINFGPVSGAAGTTTVLTVYPQCLFRGEKIMAIDSAEKRGFGTRITQVLIGLRLQRPATAGGSLTAFFAPGALGNGTKWDPCKAYACIKLTVSFVETCTFDATVFGRAVL